MMVREAGKPEQKCKVLRKWTTPDGIQAYEVQDIATGEKLTIAEGAPVGGASGKSSSAFARIFAWGNDRTPPPGAPLPPQEEVISETVLAGHQTPPMPGPVSGTTEYKLIREPGKPDQKCNILQKWTTPEGAQAYLVINPQTGETMTVVESRAGAYSGGAVAARIYSWGPDKVSPPGAPLPPSSLAMNPGPAIPPGASTDDGTEYKVIQEPGKPEQKCKVIMHWTTPDGATAFQVQDVATGEYLTIIESEPAMGRPGLAGKAGAMVARIFPWGRNRTAPAGCPMPPDGVCCGPVASPDGTAKADNGPSLEAARASATPAQPDDWRKSWGQAVDHSSQTASRPYEPAVPVSEQDEEKQLGPVTSMNSYPAPRPPSTQNRVPAAMAASERVIEMPPPQVTTGESGGLFSRIRNAWGKSTPAETVPAGVLVQPTELPAGAKPGGLARTTPPEAPKPGGLAKAPAEDAPKTADRPEAVAASRTSRTSESSKSASPATASSSLPTAEKTRSDPLKDPEKYSRRTLDLAAKTTKPSTDKPAAAPAKDTVKQVARTESVTPKDKGKVAQTSTAAPTTEQLPPSTPIAQPGSASALVAQDGSDRKVVYVPVPMMTVPAARPASPPPMHNMPRPPQPVRQGPIIPNDGKMANAFTLPEEPLEQVAQDESLSANNAFSDQPSPTRPVANGFTEEQPYQERPSAFTFPHQAGQPSPMAMQQEMARRAMMARQMPPPAAMPMPPGYYPPQAMPAGYYPPQAMHPGYPPQGMPMQPGYPPQGMPMYPGYPQGQPMHPGFYPQGPAMPPQIPNPAMMPGMVAGQANAGVQPAAYQAPASAADSKETQQYLAVLRDAMYPSQREYAAEALARADAKSNPLVLQALITAAGQDAAASVRAACVRHLARLKVDDPTYLDTLQRLKGDSDPRVRQEVEQALSATPK